MPSTASSAPRTAPRRALAASRCRIRRLPRSIRTHRSERSSTSPDRAPEGNGVVTPNSVPAMCSAAWIAALDAFNQDLRRRAVAPKTRRAYATDCKQFAQWASAPQLDPATIGVRDLRRYLAGLAQRGNSPTTIARKLASLRGLLRVQTELGNRAENPAELLSSPKRPRKLPRVLKPEEVETLLDGIP